MEEEREAHEEGAAPGWARRFMASRRRRIAFYVLMVAIAVYILVSAITDPGDWFSDGSLTTYTGTVAAPLLLLLAGRWLLREFRS